MREELRNLAKQIKSIDGLQMNFQGNSVEFRHHNFAVINSLEATLKGFKFSPGRKGDNLVLSKSRNLINHGVSQDKFVPPFLDFLKAKKL